MKPNNAGALERPDFRRRCVERDGGECVVPYCSTEVSADPEEPGDQHHIIERALWDDGGWYPGNGATVCDYHHHRAERGIIPPQAFWRWLGVEPLTPAGLAHDIDKWGEPREAPPWDEHRDYIKYPSTGHLPFSPEWDGTRVDFTELDMFADVELIVTYKMDGSNAMLVNDHDKPVRARNGSHAEHQSFDMLKQLYYEHEVSEILPEHLQVFGEWLYAKHSIHYGCEGCCPEDDQGPSLAEVAWLDAFGIDDEEAAYFQIFGVFDTRYNLWLSWPEVEEWAKRLGFPTTPCHGTNIPTEVKAPRDLYDGETGALYWGKQAVEEGHEGIIVRTRAPFHYDKFEKRVAKYVRDGHVQPGAKHWKHREIKRNEL